MRSNSSLSRQSWLLAGLFLLAIIAGGLVLVVQDDDANGQTAMGDPVAASSTDDAEADDGESWLFSYTARSGAMVELPGGTYRLTLENADEHITGFTDRPDRDTAIVPAMALFEEWSNLFSDSPPNAVLVEHDPVGASDSWVVELTEPRLKGTTATFTARILDEENQPRSGHSEGVADAPPTRFRAVSLFIDDVDTSGAANKPAFSRTVPA